MLTPQQWRPFLQTWSNQWLSTKERFPSSVRKSGWLGFSPASDAQLKKLEIRLGYNLPPSYPAFLLTTNGWRRTSAFIHALRPLNKIQWLAADDPEFIDSWADMDDLGVTLPEYFSYRGDSPDPSNTTHLQHCLVIADPIPGDSAQYFLNPKVVTKDGEWEAWFYAHWVPGFERYPSFAHLVQHEHESFQNTELGKETKQYTSGPYKGPYAPTAPRHEAQKITPGKPIPRRSTLDELVAQLEDPSKKYRTDAANKLFRQMPPLSPDVASALARFARHLPKKLVTSDNSPPRADLVPALEKVLHSASEPIVRNAAVYTLGAFCGETAVPALFVALRDPDTIHNAVSALDRLGHGADPRVADALIEWLATNPEPSLLTCALSKLADLKDNRVLPFARRLLVVPDLFSQTRFQAAFLIAHLSPAPLDELILFLTHDNPEIRVAAVGSLRETHDKRAIPYLRTATNDPDAEVRYQAAMSLRMLGEKAEISAELQEASRLQSVARIEALSKRMKSKPKRKTR